MNQQTRDGREMFLIANCVDLLRVGRLGRLGDALAARWFALEQAQLDQNWSAAKHLELYSPEHLTAAGPAITLAARKYSKLMDKVAAADDHKPRPWGKGRLGKSACGWPQAGPWQEKGGKGKGGKRQNDDKWDKWNKQGRGAWKKQPWQNSWKKTQQQDSKGRPTPRRRRRPRPRLGGLLVEIPFGLGWIPFRAGCRDVFLRFSPADGEQGPSAERSSKLASF